MCIPIVETTKNSFLSDILFLPIKYIYHVYMGIIVYNMYEMC